MRSAAWSRAHQARIVQGTASSLPLASGLSGAGLFSVTQCHTTAGGAHWYTRRIHKLVGARAGWLGALSDDTMVREVGLWTSGMLASLPADIATGVLEASSENRTGWDTYRLADHARSRGLPAARPPRTASCASSPDTARWRRPPNGGTDHSAAIWLTCTRHSGRTLVSMTRVPAS